MEDNLEVYFCDLCGTSVPEKDLQQNRARRLHGKLVGYCCLSKMQLPAAELPANGQPAAVPTGPSSSAGRGGVFAVGVFTLMAIAASTIWLEGRMTEETSELQKDVDRLDGDMKSQEGLWKNFGRRLDATLSSSSLEPVQRDLAALQVDMSALTKDTEQLTREVRTLKSVQVSGLDERLGRLTSGQRRSRQVLSEMQGELQRLSQDIAALAAKPMPTPAAAGSGDNVDIGEPEPGKSEPAPAKPGLPKALQHHVARLTDKDDSTRFEAVDQLIQSQDKRVIPHLLPMLKDSDMFVRRLTAEGLSRFRDPRCVDVLLVALADPEDLVRHTAHTSLQKLTQQDHGYKATAKTGSRNKARRRWQDWWAKNRDTFK